MKNISICPYCEKEIKLGFINGDRYTLKWVAEENDNGAVLQWFSKGVKLTEPLTNPSIESFYCESCNKIIIDTGNNVNQDL